MRLHIFAHHVGAILTQQAPTEFTLGPGDGITAKVTIEPSKFSKDPIWDNVTINGQNCGNRHGGVRVFTDMVAKAAPTIAFD